MRKFFVFLVSILLIEAGIFIQVSVSDSRKTPPFQSS